MLDAGQLYSGGGTKVCKDPQKFHAEMDEKMKNMAVEVAQIATWLTGELPEGACETKTTAMALALVPVAEAIARYRVMNQEVAEGNAVLEIAGGPGVRRPPMNPLEN